MCIEEPFNRPANHRSYKAVLVSFLGKDAIHNTAIAQDRDIVGNLPQLDELVADV